MTTTGAHDRVELRQSNSNALQLPVFIAVILLAIVLRQVFSSDPSATVYVVCAVAALLDVAFARYLMRNTATLVVTPGEITFSRGRSEAGETPKQVIKRAPDSSLGFRTARNGPMGSQHTGYVLKLRDDATGQEVFAGAFGGRRKVQEACESQGWSFG